MPTPILLTKLYTPPPRTRLVLRPRLSERLNAGIDRKLTLVSAPAGFGKTTLISEWVARGERPAAWLSLEQDDNDPVRFLTYLVAAVQTVAPTAGVGVMSALQSVQPPPPDAILTALLNEIALLPEPLILVLDDYHVIDSKPIDHSVTFLLEHLPPRLHLVITTRQDPDLPLARLRARDQLTELRAADLRFTAAEASDFLNHVMRLNLSAQDVAALEVRTEGWIAGLQLAALAMSSNRTMQGPQATSDFIKSFTGSHRFVLDYLLQEVLEQQPEHIRTFLLRTSILDRLCGPLCDAVLLALPGTGQETLEYIERANLFMIPLDDERRWYRYHHLLTELLRRRLPQSLSGDEKGGGVAALHIRAAKWYQANGLDQEAFQHAVAANEIDLAAALVEGNGMPLIFRGAAGPVLRWLESLPNEVLNARPSLWVLYGSALLFVSQIQGIEEKLQAAEAALEQIPENELTRDLIGHIASIRATVAVTQHDAGTIIAQSRRALEYLHPNNLPVRTATTWSLGYAYQLSGDRVEARRSFAEALTASRAIGHYIITFMSTLGMGNMQELDNQLPLAAQSYREYLKLAGDPPMPVACDGHLGLARILYEWNDLDASQQHAEQSVHLARQLDRFDRIVSSEVFFARLRLARNDAPGASAILTRCAQLIRERNFVHRVPEVIEAQVLVLLAQGRVQAAAELEEPHNLPLSRANILLALGKLPLALEVLESYRSEIEVRGWAHERLKTLVLQAVALQLDGQTDRALQTLSDAFALGEPGGFVRTFVDQGAPMAQLLSLAAAQGIMPDYVGKLQDALRDATGDERRMTLESDPLSVTRSGPPLSELALIDPLSPRELEILQLVSLGLSNREIAERLFLALSTVKGHIRQIFEKLQVQRRTEAVARARELGLL